MATDNSVLMNIRGLFEMEADRRAAAAATVEREKAEAAAREERERRKGEDSLRQAREEERRRARERATAHTVAVEGRIANLRAELAEVRAAREQMSLEVAAIAARPVSASGPANWIAGAMAAVSLIAAVTATAVSWPHPAPPLDATPVVAEVETTLLEVEAPALEEVVVATVTADETPVTDETPDVATHQRPTRPQPPRHQQNDLAHQLDFGAEDGLIPDI